MRAIRTTFADNSSLIQGSGGGPSEDNVTGLLVRSTAANWARGSLLAVDAGSHLASITRILEKDLPLVSQALEELPVEDSPTDDSQLGGSSPVSSPVRHETPPPPPAPTILEHGPFAGVPLPFASARANSAHIVRTHVSTYLITHPHLDHLSAFAINTASFHATSRPKKMAALPFTVDAIKRHIFNDVIWPNMTDEDGGVGFVTFQRLKEGGDVMVGEGNGRGYIEICEGLGVKGYKISHGNCMRGGAPKQSHRDSLGNTSDSYTPGGRGHDRRSISASHAMGMHNIDYGYNSPGGRGRGSQSYDNDDHQNTHQSSVVDSTVYFIRDCATSQEVLIFGDVEPDSVSFSPRLAGIWQEAAPKIASGILTGVFIECSYDDSQPDAVLFGHMAPRHIVAELQSLAEMVKDEKIARALERAQRKRKRSVVPGMAEPSLLNDAIEKKRNRSMGQGQRTQPGTPLRRSSLPTAVPEEVIGSPLALTTVPKTVGFPPEMASTTPPLEGLRVVLIHIKDTLKDGPHVSERILRQLNAHAVALDEAGWGKLGCEFIISESGKDYFF